MNQEGGELVFKTKNILLKKELKTFYGSYHKANINRT